MSAGGSIGSVFVELSMDSRNYTSAQKRILDGARTTSLAIEKNWDTIGATSNRMYDAMRQRITNAYEQIKHSGKATADELVRAEKSKAEKIRAIDEQQFGRQFNLLETLRNNWKMYALAAVAALVAVAKRAIDLGAQLDDMSKKFGVSGSELSKWSYAAKMSGVDLEGVGNSMRFLSRSISEAHNPASEAAIAFNLLGVSAQDLSGLTTSEVFELLADRFYAVEDGANKTAIAMKLFGRSGADMLPIMEQGAEGIRKAKDEAVRLGIALTDKEIKTLGAYDDAWDRLIMRLESFAAKMIVRVVPALKAGLKYIMPMQSFLAGKAFGEAPASTAGADAEAVGVDSWGPAKKAVGSIGAAKDGSNVTKKATDAYLDTLTKQRSYYEAYDKEIAGIIQKSHTDELKLRDEELKTYIANIESMKAADEMLAEAQQYRNDASLENVYSNAVGRGDSGTAIQALNDGYAEQIRLSEEAQNAASSYADVWIEAHRSIGDMAVSVGMGVRDGLVGALTDVMTGAASLGEAFRELGKSILNMLAETFARWVVNRMAMAVLGKTMMAAETAATVAFGATAAAALAPAAAFMEVITLGAATGPAMAGLASTVALAQALAIPALAEGGIVDRPTIALIGEKGREKVTPLDEGSGGGGDIYIDGEKFGRWLERRSRQFGGPQLVLT